MDYNQHYELTDILNKDPNIIPAPKLYNFDDRAIYSSAMDRISQPLPTGLPSPFTSRSPGSAHSFLLETVAFNQSLIGHQINLMDLLAWVNIYRMLGMELSPAEYPIINMTFRRSIDARDSNIDVVIPFGTEVRSSLSPDLYAITIEDGVISGTGLTVDIPARLNRLGKVGDIRANEFTDIPRLISFIESATNDGIILYEGREAETLAEAMLRSREEYRTGDRCVTPKDYHTTAITYGALKANVLTGIQYGAEGIYNDNISVFVYPASTVTAVEAVVKRKSMLESRVDVRPADIIPIDGVIEIAVTAETSNETALDGAIEAIVNSINPPNGEWGDRSFKNSLATVLEKVPGIYAVPKMELKNSQTNQKLEDMQIRPWHLLEIQESIQIVPVREAKK